MKICFFTENHYKGGLDTFIINLFNSWPDRSDKLILICNNSHPGLETITSNVGMNVSVKRYSRFFTSSFFMRSISSTSTLTSFFFRVLYRVLEYPVLFPWYCLSLAFYFRKSGCDRLMVINGGYPASLICRCALIGWVLSGRKHAPLFNFHNSTQAPAWYASWPENFIDRLVLKYSSSIVTVSKNCMESLYTRKSFLGSQKLRYISNGIDDPLNRNTANTRTKKNEFGDYCLMLATYEPRKGHLFMLTAFSQVILEFPEAQLLMFGYGPEEEKQYIRDNIKKLSLENNVLLGDFVSETTELINNAKVLVVPSQAQESFGLTIIEAMALSTPVVTTDVGGMPEVLAGSNCGFICPKEDPLAFAKAIKSILSDPQLAMAMGSNGRKTFENKFQANLMASQYEALLMAS